jgi:acyl-CoA synthetase (NDP forming)
VLKNIIELGYQGKIYPINPNVETLLGLPVFASIKEVPDTIELVIIITPTPLVPNIVRECAEVGVKGAVIITEGFAETGDAENLQLQEELKQIATDTGIRILGPGTMGIVNLQENFTSSYVEFNGLKTTGNITFMAQSGIFTGGLVRYFATYDIPVSRIISLGNKVDVDDADILTYLENDPQTEVVALYIEGITDGPRFIEAARRFSKKKPLVVLKGGTTPAGARAASSHTGSIAVNSDIFDAVVKKTGIVQVETLADLFQTPHAFSITPVLPQGPRIAIITYSGCLGVLSSDAILKLGLQLASFTQETNEKIHEVVYDRKFGANPIDTYPATIRMGNEHVFTTCLDAVLEDSNVDGCIITVWGDETPEEHQFTPHIRDTIVRHQKQGKFTIVPVLGEKLGVERERKFLEESGIVTTIFADRAVKLYFYLYQYAQFLKSIQ